MRFAFINLVPSDVMYGVVPLLAVFLADCGPSQKKDDTIVTPTADAGNGGRAGSSEPATPGEPAPSDVVTGENQCAFKITYGTDVDLPSDAFGNYPPVPEGTCDMTALYVVKDQVATMTCNCVQDRLNTDTSASFLFNVSYAASFGDIVPVVTTDTSFTAQNLLAQYGAGGDADTEHFWTCTSSAMRMGSSGTFSFQIDQAGLQQAKPTFQQSLLHGSGHFVCPAFLMPGSPGNGPLTIDLTF